LTIVSQPALQVTFAAEFDETRNTSDEGIALDDISMNDGSCAAAGYCYSSCQESKLSNGYLLPISPG